MSEKEIEKLKQTLKKSFKDVIVFNSAEECQNYFDPVKQAQEIIKEYNIDGRKYSK